MKIFNYLFETDFSRNSSKKIFGVLKGSGVQLMLRRRTLLAKTMGKKSLKVKWDLTTDRNLTVGA